MLGSWADPTPAKTILDIGTGSGILALMMAQKSNALITAIDLDADAYEQAKENAEGSPWNDRIQIAHSSLQDFVVQSTSAPQKFDLIITNPPYFNNQAHATGTALSNARNTARLSFEELVKASLQLLNKDGKFYVVLPTPEAKQFKGIAEKAGLVLSKLLRVQTKAGEAYEKRHLMLFQKTAFLYEEKTLIIEDGHHHQYSDAYRTLTRDFYLAF